MGVGTAAYMQRGRADRETPPHERFTDTLRFLDYCRSLGAGGVQASLTSHDSPYLARLRDTAREAGMYVEVSARLPRDDSDAERFEQTVRSAKQAGASVIRTVMLGGRRYETFGDLASWRAFERQSWRSLTLAEPILARNDMRLAVENHKDWRIEELLAILERIDSEAVGVTIDTGNNMSLLEDPLETVRAFAPYANSVHLKDMAVEAYEDGFLLSEVPFGEGLLDLKSIVDAIRAKRPKVRFTLEMITRDPLRIPCLKEDYWITMADVPGSDLARALRSVGQRGTSLPRIEQLPLQERFRIEDQNNRACLEYGASHLGL